MSFINEKHNKKTLANRLGYSPRQLRNKLKALLEDKEISKEFGKYSYPFTIKQLEIIRDNIGEPPNNN